MAALVARGKQTMALNMAKQYGQNNTPQQYLRAQQVVQGSSICNLARSNTYIIQQHCFWEDHNGQNVFF